MEETIKQGVTLENVKVDRDYYKVLLISQSGKGKTYSFKNMNPETTGIVNCESKPLPFKTKFKYHSKPMDRISTINSIVEYAKNPNIDCICVDSLSAFLDILLAEARNTRKGFDIYTFYNEELAKFFTLIKKIRKEVFITGHYEILGIEGNQERRLKITGKAWEGWGEKEFTVVLYGDNTIDDKGNSTHFFITRGEGISAKCPPDLFEDNPLKVPNDCNLVLNAIKKFAE